MLNIKDYRKKKQKDEFKQKLIRHRLVIIYRTVLALAAVIVAGILLFINYKNKVYSGYEVVQEYERQDADESDYIMSNGNVLKYSQDGAEVFDASNHVIWNETYEMQNPMVATCRDSVAICDYKGNKIYVINDAGEQGIIETKLPITNLSVSQQGVVAAVLEDGDTTRIFLYSKEGEELINIKCTMSQSGYPVDLSLSDDGIKLGVSYMRIEKGELKSSVAFYNFGDVGQNEIDNYASGYDYVDTVVPKVKFINSSTAFALGDNRFSVYKGNQKPTSVFDLILNEEVQSVFYGNKSVGLVFRTSESEMKYRIDVYDESGNLSLSQKFDIDYTDIILKDDIIIIYNDSRCKIYNLNGVEKFNGEFEEPVLLLVPTEQNSKYTLVNRDSVKTIRLK